MNLDLNKLSPDKFLFIPFDLFKRILPLYSSLSEKKEISPKLLDGAEESRCLCKRVGSRVAQSEKTKRISTHDIRLAREPMKIEEKIHVGWGSEPDLGD